MRGARLIAVPSAFTAATGRDHWEVLLRARAIENQAFVLAPNQVGEAPPHYSSFGHSAIVDPWGVVLAIAPDEECFVAADLDLAAQDRVRESLPSLANRRPGAYAWPQLRRRTPDGRQSRRRSTSAARSSTRRSASSPARASTRPASPTSPTRRASPTGSSTTTSTPRTRC